MTAGFNSDIFDIKGLQIPFMKIENLLKANKEAICDELVRVNIYRAEHNAGPLL